MVKLDPGLIHTQASQRAPKVARKPLEAGERRRSSGFQRRMALNSTWLQTPSLQDYKTTHFYGLEPLGDGAFDTAAVGS